MTFIYNFYLFNFTSKIVCLIIFPEFLSFIYVISKLSILSNHAEHSKRLIPYYVLPLFIILKSPYPIGQPVYLKEDDFSFARKKSSYIKNLDL